jgi:DNA-directed RNA polymerase subunit F
MKLKIYFLLFVSFISFGTLQAKKSFTPKGGIDDNINLPTLPVFLNLPGSATGKLPEMFKFDSLSNTWRPQAMLYPLMQDYEKMKAMTFDPVRFTIKANKDSVKVGEQIEMTITAQYIDVNGMTMFQFEGSNYYTLKMIMPAGFVLTGGTYYDYLQGMVDKQNPSKIYTIKGYFENIDKESCFKLLRSKKESNFLDYFYSPASYCVKFSEEKKIKKPATSKLKPNNTSTIASFSNSIPFCTTDLVTFRAGINTLPDLGPQYGCLTTQPNPIWYHLKIGTPGSITITISAVNDVDYICYGPFNSLEESRNVNNLTLLNSRNNQSVPTSSRCGYSTSNVEILNITNAVAGKYYILLITNFANTNQDISFQKTAGAGETDCSIVSLCSIPDSPTFTTTSSNAPATITANCLTGTIKWNDSSTSASITANAAGTYSAICSLGVNCESNSSSITIQNCVAPAAPTLSTYYKVLTEGTTNHAITATCLSPNTVLWSYNNSTSNPITVPVGFYTAQCVSASNCKSVASSPAEIKSATCPYTITIATNGSTGEVSVGELLQLWSSVSTTPPANATYQWYRDDVAIPGKTANYISEASAVTGFSGRYKLGITDPATNKTCYSNDVYVTISPCNIAATLSYQMLSNNTELWVNAQFNKPCTGCTVTFFRSGTLVEQGFNTYILKPNNAVNRGVYTANILTPAGCTHTTNSLTVDFLATPNFQALVQNLYCDNVSGYVSDLANPTVQQKAQLVIKNLSGADIYTQEIIGNGNGSGTWSYNVPFPDAYKNGNTYKVGVRHIQIDNNGITSYPASPPTFINKELSCCKLSMAKIETDPQCDPSTKTNILRFKFANRNVGIPLYYKLFKKKYLEFNGVGYDDVGTYVNIPATVLDSTWVEVPNIPTGEYKIELRQAILGAPTNCVVNDFFSIDCSILIGGCRPPVITVAPADSVQEGLGTAPTLYANFLSTNGINATPNAGFVAAVTLDGNGSLGLPDMGGWQNITTEAYVNIAPNTTITVGQQGDGQKHRNLFTSKYDPNQVFWNLSVGSNGITLIEKLPFTGSSRVALSANYNLTGWHQVALVYENNLPKVYIDGAELVKAEKTAQQHFIIPSGYQVLGAQKIGDDQQKGFKGLIDELKVYTRALSKADILANKLVRNNPTLLSQDNDLQMYYSFEGAQPYQNKISPAQALPSRNGDINILTIPLAASNPLNTIQNTSSLDWYYKNTLVASKEVKYTMPKELVRVGSYTYKVKFLGTNGEQCETEKTVVVKPMQMSKLSGCFTMVSQNFSSGSLVSKNVPGEGAVYMQHNPNPAGDNLIWKFEYTGGKNYKIMAAATDLFFTKNVSNFAVRLVPRNNADPDQNFEVKYLDSTSAQPVIRIYSKSGETRTLTMPSNAYQNALLNTTEFANSATEQNFVLKPAGCPTPTKPCSNSDGKITVEKLPITNPNAVSYLNSNLDKIETFVNKYRKNEQVLTYNSTYLNTYVFQDFIPTKLLNGTISTAAQDNYVARLSGFFCSPGTGDFVFDLKTVGKAKMYISPNEDPRAKKLMITNLANSSTSGTLASIPLTAGRSYYYEIVILDQTNDWDFLKLNVDGPLIYNGTNAVPLQYFSSTPRDTKPKKVRPDVEVCRALPPPPSDSDDMPNIFVGDTIVAGDFYVIVDGVTGGNGTFTGNGHAKFKYILNRSVAVKFEGIRVNDYYELVEGEISTEYDKDWGNIVDVDTLIQDFIQEVTTAAQAAKVFLKTAWEKISPKAAQDYVDSYIPLLESEYDKATADAYRPVLQCLLNNNAIIDRNRAICDGFPKIPLACDSVAVATAAINGPGGCKAQLAALEAQRELKLNQALQIIVKTLDKISNQTISSTDMTTAAVAIRDIVRPTTSVIVLPSQKFYSAGEFSLDDIAPTRKTNIVNYYKKEMEYNNNFVAKYFGKLNFSNSAKHKELAESLVAKNGSKVSKYILEKLPVAPNSPAEIALILEVENMMKEQIFELILSSKVYAK